MNAFCIRCMSCNKRYILGEDAAIATTSGLFSHLGGGGFMIGGSPQNDGTRDDPDLVDASSLDPAEYAERFGAEVERITSSLASEMQRWWKCDSCKFVQPYSPIAISVTDFTGATEGEADAAARSAVSADRIIQVSLQAASKGVFGIGKKPVIAKVRHEVEGVNEWITNHAADLAAFAWESYKEKGRGMVLVLALKAKPWEAWYTGAQFGYLDQVTMEQKPANEDDIARVREYDPSSEFLIVVLRRKSGAVNTVRPELPPPQAYEQNKHDYKQRLISE